MRTRLFLCLYVFVFCIVRCRSNVWQMKKPDAVQDSVVKANRIELMGKDGKPRLTMSVENDAPRITMMTSKGSPALEIALDDKGRGAIYLSTDRTDAKVTIGYFNGSDTGSKSGEQWGLRVLDKKMIPKTLSSED